MYMRSVVRAMGQLKMNWVIKILIISDFLIWVSYQLFAPIFAVFVTDQLFGGSLEVVGISSSIYFVAKSVVEAPVGMWIDRTRAETDDLLTALVGTILTALVFFSYNFMTDIWQLYVAQGILGIGAAVAFPGWYSIFTRHIDKHKEALEWSLYDVLLGIGMAGSAALGGFLATEYGFSLVFNLAGVSTIVGAILLLTIRNKICRRENFC